jgi:hypothetical protein
MKLMHEELEFLSAWARVEWEPECYDLPAHRMQLAHGVTGAELIVLIKAWTEREGKKDQEIVAAAVNPQPRGPWYTNEDFADRVAEAGEW